MALLLAALLVAADQISKAWVVTALPVGSREMALGLGFHLVHVRNNGAAFGILQNLHLRAFGLDIDGTVALAVLSALVAVVIAATLVRSGRNFSTLTRVALALVLAGATGNMIDRFRLHYVIDFVHFHVRGFDFAVFNVADASIVIGAGLLLLASAVQPRATGPEPTARRSPAHPRHHAAGAGVADFPDVPPLRPEGDGARGEPEHSS